MNRVFADTWYFLAALNPSDPNHVRALNTGKNDRRQRVTTDYVLLEVGDALCGQGNRDVFARFYDWIHRQAGTIVIPATHQLLEDGVHLYRHRRDKDWPLTDCISFVVMEDEGIREALTGDHHFEQAGYVALLKQPDGILGRACGWTRLWKRACAAERNLAMASFIPNHRKKIERLSKKEQQLRRLVEHGAGLETLLTVALEIRNCRIRVLKAKQNKNPERNAEERTEFLRDGKRIRVLQSLTAESILTEFFRSVVSN